VSSPNPKGQHARIVIEGRTPEGTLYYNESQIFSDFGEGANFENVSSQLGLSNHQGKYTINSTNYLDYCHDKLEAYNEGTKEADLYPKNFKLRRGARRRGGGSVHVVHNRP